MTAPSSSNPQVEGFQVDVGSVMSHLEQILIVNIRELAATRARLVIVEDEKAELQRQLRVREASSISDSSTGDSPSE
jgi:hypothetical protein